jgi:hypothetical protein
MKLQRITYAKLDSKQKENFNYQKISAVLADYGYVTMRLSADWQGADFIAQHIDGQTFLRVQLKSRLTVQKKYQGKDIYIAFPDAGHWYLYPHDELLQKLLQTTNIPNTDSWTTSGGYSTRLSKEHRQLLAPYCITGDATPIEA